MATYFDVSGPVNLYQSIDFDNLLTVTDGGGTYTYQEVFVPSSDDFALAIDIFTPNDGVHDIDTVIKVMMIYDTGIDTGSPPGVTHSLFDPGFTHHSFCDGTTYSLAFDLGGATPPAWLNTDGTFVHADSGIYVALISLSVIVD